MSKFKYKALDHQGRNVRGSLEAASYESAVQMLQAKGLWVHKLDEQTAESRLWSKLHTLMTKDLFGGPKVKQQHLMLFCRQLATLYKAGVPLATSISTLAEQTSARPLKKVLLNVAQHMNAGLQFSEALSKFPTVFPVIFISMANAGEESGNLDEMLERLALYFEKEHFTKEKMKTALAYPTFLAIMTVVVTTILMIFVVPQFTSNFAQLGMTLPWPTQLVIQLSEWASRYWMIIPLIATVIILTVRKIKQNLSSRYYWDHFRLRIPILGSLWRSQILARFSRTFSSLVASGVSMLDILEIVSRVVDNAVVGKLVQEARTRVRGGFSISEPFANHSLFPPMVIQMITLGESSGKFDEVMEKVANYYEAEVDSMSERIKSLLEPIMLLVLAGVVGLIVMAIMLPSFTMINQLD